QQTVVMKPLILFITVLVSAQSFAQDFYPLKRKPFKYSVTVDKKTAFEQEVPESEYLLPDLTLQIYAGETVFLEIEQENGKITNIKAVAENRFPAKTLVVSFEQKATKKVHETMMLKVFNPFTYSLKYDCKIFLAQYKKWVNTNVLDVQPKLSGIEMWPDVATSISLGGFTLIK
ncbi:MAG: hypothetical protein ABW036_11740, partial [Flavitalea sp.]